MMLGGNQLYWLLLIVPVALVIDELHLSTGVVFGVTLAAILPLAVRAPPAAAAHSASCTRARWHTGRRARTPVVRRACSGR